MAFPPRRFKALVRLPSGGTSRIEVELPSNATQNDAQTILENQYGRGNVSEVSPTFSRSTPKLSGRGGKGSGFVAASVPFDTSDDEGAEPELAENAPLTRAQRIASGEKIGWFTEAWFTVFLAVFIFLFSSVGSGIVFLIFWAWLGINVPTFSACGLTFVIIEFLWIRQFPDAWRVWSIIALHLGFLCGITYLAMRMWI